MRLKLLNVGKEDYIIKLAPKEQLVKSIETIIV
jgi:hypothetical protein